LQPKTPGALLLVKMPNAFEDSFKKKAQEPQTFSKSSFHLPGIIHFIATIIGVELNQHVQTLNPIQFIIRQS
jgi:hypothetical protein